MAAEMALARKNVIMGTWGKRLYLLTLFTLVFTGFGQLPIFKRYYLADIPGLAWTADFYVTLFIHYVAGIVFVLLCGYYAVGYLRRGLPSGKLLWKYLIRAGLIVLLLASGFMLAVRNMTTVSLTPSVSFVTVWVHFLLTMAFLIAAATYLRNRRSHNSA